MKPYEYIDNFTIKYCDVDFKDQIKVATTLALMEEVASGSADELGFGLAYLKPRGFAFFVSNIYLEFIRPISLGEMVVVKTWPSIPSYVVFGREYQFQSESGEILIKATSRWCLLDFKSYKVLPSRMIEGQNYATYNTKLLFDNIQWRIPVKTFDESDLRFTISIANSECDHNMHVNNTRYAEYCMNCFSMNELSNRMLKSFQISYIKQSKEGDFLRFYRQDDTQGKTFIQGYNQRDELVIQACVSFVE